ncbi:MAG: hypothetical protein AAF514_21595 [Verrucomicrobiota bacterium]
MIRRKRYLKEVKSTNFLSNLYMKTLKSILALALFWSFSAFAQEETEKKNEATLDLAGEWNASASTDAGDRELKWTFKKAEDGFSGMSHDPETSEDRKFDRIKVEGKKVTLEIDVEQDGNSGVIQVIAEEKKAGQLSGKWKIADTDGNELMGGELKAEKKIEIAFAGEWKTTSVLPDETELNSVVTLKGKNDALKGELMSEDGNTIEIDKFATKEKDLEMHFDFEMNGSTINVVVKSSLESEDKLNGQWAVIGEDGSEAMTGKWSAERVKAPSVEGDWVVKATVPESDDYTGALTLKKDGEKWKGTSTSDSDGESRDLSTASFEKDQLTFTTPFEAGGAEGTITVKATLKEDKLTGTWSLTDSSDTELASDAWEATRKVK